MISIITSAYKAENTISRAIESLLAQTYKDWEMIIVVDASPDNTYNIALTYANKDNRIKVINNKENVGAGMARRIGIKNINSNTEYTTFLDSDDYYKPELLEVLYKNAKETDADVIHPGHIIVENNKEIALVPKYKLCTGKDTVVSDNSGTNHFMNTFLFKKWLWDKVEYSDRRYIEDTPTLLQLLYYANSILHLDYAGYYYIQNTDSLIHTASPIKNCIYLLLHSVTSFEFGKKVDCKQIIEASLNNFISNIYKLKEYQKIPSYNKEISQYKEEISEIFNFFIKIIV